MKKPTKKIKESTAVIPRKRGAPKGNNNGVRHGLKSGKLPPDARFIEIRCNLFRRGVEKAVLDAKGDIDLCDAAHINSACRWEKHACLCHRWLTQQWKKLKPDDLVTFSREIARASDNRDKALREIGLPRSTVKTLTLTDYIKVSS